MTFDEKHWQRVNAYVDGELDPASAADIAAAVARDRALADAVATLTQLKAATAASVEAPAISIREPRRPWHRLALAASLALAIGLAAAIALHAGRDDSSSFARAVERHTAWAASERTEAGTELPGPTLAGLARLGFAAEIPDLADAGLTLAQVTVVDERDGAAGFQIRYVGTRGCRVSLLVERARSGTAAARQNVGSVRAVSWLVQDLQYTLLASGMYEQRFETIAATAEASTRRERPTVDRLRQALREQREQSPPCLG